MDTKFLNWSIRPFRGVDMGFFDVGYQIFSHVYSQVEIEYARQEVERLSQELKPGDELGERNIIPLSDLKEHRNPGVAKESLQGIPFVIGELPSFSEALKAFILHAPLWSMAREILGSDDVVYHFSNVTRKPARVGPNMSWHRDYPNRYLCPRRASDFLRLLIPLEGMDEENGCAEAVPKSHEIMDEEAITIEEERRRDFDLRSAVPLKTAAGDVVAIHSKLLHGGRENRSARERDLVVIQFGIKTDQFLYRNEECFTGLTREEILANGMNDPKERSPL